MYIEAIKKSRELLLKGWTQEAYARDEEGHSVDVYSQRASQFCMMGAALRVTKDLRLPVDPIRWKLRAVIGDGDVTEFNDAPKRTHAEVIAVFDEVLKREQELCR